jgi:hypothetical protein
MTNRKNNLITHFLIPVVVTIYLARDRSPHGLVLILLVWGIAFAILRKPAAFTPAATVRFWIGATLMVCGALAYSRVIAFTHNYSDDPIPPDAEPLAPFIIGGLSAIVIGLTILLTRRE